MKYRGWIPATEKPKPGTPVIAYGVNEYDKGRIIRAVWFPKFFQEDEENHAGDADYCDSDDTFYLPEGWYEWNDTEDTHWFVQYPILSWMPLPNPPEATDEI